MHIDELLSSDNDFSYENIDVHTNDLIQNDFNLNDLCNIGIDLEDLLNPNLEFDSLNWQQEPINRQNIAKNSMFIAFENYRSEDCNIKIESINNQNNHHLFEAITLKPIIQSTDKIVKDVLAIPMYINQDEEQNEDDEKTSKLDEITQYVDNYFEQFNTDENNNEEINETNGFLLNDQEKELLQTCLTQFDFSEDSNFSGTSTSDMINDDSSSNTTGTIYKSPTKVTTRISQMQLPVFSIDLERVLNRPIVQNEIENILLKMSHEIIEFCKSTQYELNKKTYKPLCESILCRYKYLDRAIENAFSNQRKDRKGQQWRRKYPANNYTFLSRSISKVLHERKKRNKV